MQFPPMEDVASLMVKELTLKTHATGANNRLAVASAKIKECLIQVKNQETVSEFQELQKKNEPETLVTQKSVHKD